MPRERTGRKSQCSSRHLTLLTHLDLHQLLSPRLTDYSTQQKQKDFLFYLALLNAHPGRCYVIMRSSPERGILITDCASLVLEAKPQPALGPITPFEGAILRAAGCVLTPAASHHTYLKTILLILAFTSCCDERASKGNSSRGVELNCIAPTRTCRRRQRAQGSENKVKSQTFLREKKGPER